MREWSKTEDAVLEVECLCGAFEADKWAYRAKMMTKRFERAFTAKDCMDRARKLGFEVLR